MVGAAVQTNSKSQLFYPAVWLVVTSLLAVSFQVVGVPEALGDEVPTTTIGNSSDYPLAGVDPGEEPFPSTLYAGALWSVTDTRVTAVEGLLQRASVEVDLVVTNTLATTQLRIPNSMVSLISEDGLSAGEARFVDAGARLSIDPGDSVELVALFEVGFNQAPDPATLIVQIAEANRVPAQIPLSGARQSTDYPIYAAIDTRQAIVTGPDVAAKQIIVQPSAAVVDLNAGPYRAAVGERVAVFKVLVERAESDPEADHLNNGYWGLDADGEVVNALLVTRTAEPSSNTDEVTILFSFPEDAGTLSLVAALGTDEATAFAAVLPR